jgi:hypothetical protein
MGFTLQWQGHDRLDGALRRTASEWRVQDGVLIGAGGESFLLTTRNDYVNFRLRAQVMINDGGTSALLGRVQENRGVRSSRSEVIPLTLVA